MVLWKVRRTKGENHPPFFYGWVIVAAAFVANTTWGILFSYGVFFKPLVIEFGWSNTAASLAFSIQAVFNSLSVILMGQMSDKYGPRATTALGASLTGLGMALCSQITDIWHLYLFWGVIMGLGSGAFFIPLAATTTRWFVKKRGLAVGILAAGIGVGTLILAPITDLIIATRGWRATFLIEGSTYFTILLLTAVFLRRSPEEMGLKPYGEEVGGVATLKLSSPVASWRSKVWELVRTRSFWMMYIMYLSGTLGQTMVAVHMVPYAIDVAIPSDTAAGAFGVIGFVSIFGKVMMGSLSDKVGRLRTLAICYLFQAVAMFWMAGLRGTWMLYVFALLYGVSYGGWVPQYPPLIGELYGLRHAGAFLGILYTAYGAGGIIGPMMGGYVSDVFGSYSWAFLTSSIIYISALCVSITMRPQRSSRHRDNH